MPLSGAANPHEDGSHPPTSTPASLTMRGSPPEEDGTHATPWRSVEREREIRAHAGELDERDEPRDGDQEGPAVRVVTSALGSPSKVVRGLEERSALLAARARP